MILLQGCLLRPPGVPACPSLAMTAPLEELEARRQNFYNGAKRISSSREMGMAEYSDIAFHIHEGIARITINRPDRYNAFRALTCEELIDAFNKAGWDRSVGVIVLTGAGDKAFCTGGDQGTHEGGYGGRGTIGLPLEELHGLMRDVPKPVIARVNGFAI